MDNLLTRATDRFLGRGEASIAIPPMDGALKPNGLVDEARHLATLEAPDNLVRSEDRMFFSSGRKLLTAGEDWAKIETVTECQGDILAVAVGARGQLAIFDEVYGLSIMDGATRDSTRVDVASLPFRSVTAAAFQDDTTLVVCVGSSSNPASDWQRDLLESRSAGSVWTVDIRSGALKTIADRLAYPAGCLVLPDGRSALVSESWQNRLLRIDLGGKADPEPVLTALPGYPSRLSLRSGGGAWLSLFAPRNQLVEFVRREPVYRKAMMAEVPKAFWVAPSLASGASFSEPMQGGALKQMGILKPWAPTRSYGLVVGIDAAHSPVLSFHSRTGGRRHGLTSAVEWGADLVVTSKGGDEIISIAIQDGHHAD